LLETVYSQKGNFVLLPFTA